MRSGCFIVLLLIALPARAQRLWDTIPNLPDHYRKRIEIFAREPVAPGRTLFLGNSITEGGNWKKLLKDSTIINRGISGDIAFGVLNRLDDVIRRKPSKIFLLIGINDISKNIPDEVIIENLLTIVSRIHSGAPQAKVFVQSILPVNNSFKQFPINYDKNDHIITINDQMKKYAERMKYVYVDLYKDFLDKEDRLDVRYSTDGLHLNAAGYQHWVAILKNFNYL